MTPASHQTLGKWGEQIAAEYLTQHAYLLLERNLRTPYGEIDIVASQDDMLVFIEVKTRSSNSLGFPEISITPKKFSHMLSSAQAYLLDHPDLKSPWRIDVISIQRLAPGQPPEVAHFENVNAVS